MLGFTRYVFASAPATSAANRCRTIRQSEGRFRARSRHGNYNAWLDAVGFAQYDIIVNIDPDHVPDLDVSA